MSSSKPSEPAKEESVKAIAVKQNIPIQLTDLAMFDDTYAFMKERFEEEMKRVDSQMIRLNKALTNFYHQALTIQTGLTSSEENEVSDWDSIANSPLVEGEGESKALKLQFDLSQFDPEEVTVLVTDDILTVSAIHVEKDEKYNVYREYNRQFQLPVGTNPDQIVSSMSRDGILTVHAPLLNPADATLSEHRPTLLRIDNN